MTRWAEEWRDCYQPLCCRRCSPSMVRIDWTKMLGGSHVGVSRTMRLASRVLMWACLLAPLPHDLSRACTHAMVLGSSSRCKWLRNLMWCWLCVGNQRT